MPVAAQHLSTTAVAFHALSDVTRLAVLDLLRDGERCVCDLQAALDVAQSRLSFHLKVLRDAGLVRDRRAGRWAYYRLAPDAFREVQARLHAFSTVNVAESSAASGALPARCCD